jgi:hypothetical protein
MCAPAIGDLAVSASLFMCGNERLRQPPAMAGFGGSWNDCRSASWPGFLTASVSAANACLACRMQQPCGGNGCSGVVCINLC